MKNYDLTTDQSGMFFRVGYDPEKFTLRLGFRKNGRVYDYFGVPHAEAGRLVFSKMSEVFNARIRDNYEVKEVTDEAIPPPEPTTLLDQAKANPLLMGLLDAAVDLAVFCKTNEYPDKMSQGMFELTDKVDALETSLRKAKVIPPGRVGA